MKKSRRLVAAFLTAITAFGIFASMPVMAATGGEEDVSVASNAVSSFNTDDYYKYKEDFLKSELGLSSVYNFLVNTARMPYRDFVETLNNDTSFQVALAAWKLATLSPESMADEITKSKQCKYSEAILIDLLVRDTQEETFTDEIEKLNESIHVTALKKYIDFNGGILKNIKITPENATQVLKDMKQMNAFSEALKVVDDISDGIELCTDTVELIEKLAKVETIIEMSDGYKQVLKDMSNNCEDKYLKTAIDKVLLCFDENLSSSQIKAIFVGDNAIHNVWKGFMKSVKKSVIDLLGLVGLAIDLAQSAGTAVANALFGTEDAITDYYQMNCLYKIEDLIRDEVLNTSGETFCAAYSMYQNTMLMGCDYSKKFVGPLYESPFGRLFTWFGDKYKKYEDYVAEVDKLKKHYVFQFDRYEKMISFCYMLDTNNVENWKLVTGEAAYPEVTEEEVKKEQEDLENTYYEYAQSLFDYEEYDSYVEITGYKGSSSYVIIPSRINGKPVTSIGDWAFSGCTSLESIIIPDSVTSIGFDAFRGCTTLKSVTIPDSVTHIITYRSHSWDYSPPFKDCTSLESINVSKGNKVYSSIDGVLFYKVYEYRTGDDLVRYPQGRSGTEYVIPNISCTEIRDGAFMDCVNLTSVTIPNSFKQIDDFAFEGCINLTNVKIPNSVGLIGESAFKGCTSLTNITLPDNPDNYYYFHMNPNQYNIPIGNSAFECCTSLTSITIPYGVTSIKYGTFRNCTSLTSVTISNSVTSIDTEAFNGCTSLKSVTIPSTVTGIGDRAFGYYYDENTGNTEKIDDFTINGYTNSIAERYAKENGFEFKSIGTVSPWIYNYDDGITTITKYTGSASELEIPSEINGKNVTLIIGSSAFSGCTSLNSLTISNSVKSIDKYAFYNCTNLKSITIPDSVASIRDGAFEGCESLTSVTIPNSVTSIGRYAFSGCTSLKCITIPNGVTSIGESTFKDCTSLESVTIPNSVTSIGDGAFSGCTSLESITIPNSVTSIGRCAFNKCTSLKSVTVPNSVTSIGYYAFEDCESLTSVTIPNSVTSIGTYAFNGCTNLTIYGAKGSAAEEYANENGIKFVDMSTIREIKNANINLANTTYTYTGKAITPAVTVKNSKTTLQNGTDYTVAYENNINVGTATVTITGKGNYTGTKTTTFKIVPMNASNLTVSGIANKTYTGKAIAPTVIVKNGSTTLKNGTDYTVSYENNINAGTATVTITGKGNYSGTKTATFKILPISASSLTISGIANKTYTGKAIVPTVIVKNGNTTLKNGTDYTVSYKNNTNVGTATVTITGKGNYTGTKTATFKIVAPTVANIKSLKATQSTSAVKLSWGKVSGATSYDVYQKIGGKWKKVATTRSTSYTVNKLKAGTVYNFAVRVNKTVGNKTFNGAFAFITTATKPANVKSLKAAQNTSAVKLSWGKVSGATNYDVYQKVNGKWKKVVTTKSTSYTVKKLKAGTVYNFAVRANKVVGKTTYNGAFTFITTATKTATPTMAVKAAGSKKATVTWKKVSGATGYEVFMSTKKTSGYKKVATVSAKKTAKYTKANLKKGKTYYVRVRTYKTVGKAKIYSGYQTKAVKIK